MNILIYRYGSICEPDIIEAFNRMSVHVDEVTDEIYNKKITPAEGITVLKKRLDSGTAYSLVFTVNFFPWIAEVCRLVLRLFARLATTQETLTSSASMR